MKNLKLQLVALALLCSGISFAQPSDSQIRSRAMGHGAKSVDFYGTGNIHNTVTETYYIRSFVAKYDTEYPGVTQEVSTEYKYTKTGGTWAFTKEFIVQSVYDGIDNPTEDELLTMINADLKEFLAGSYTDVVGEIEYIKLAEDPHWLWNSVSSVEVDLEAVYSKKMSSTKISKVKQIHTIKLYSDGFKKPWKSFKGSKSGYPDILSTKEYTADELRQIKTLYQIQLDKEAEAIMAGLPKITIPEFKNEKEAVVHTFKMLREATHEEFQAYLYQMLSPRYFDENSKVLNSSGERVFSDIEPMFAEATRFKYQYCEFPQLKTEADNKIEFWNKSKDRYSRITINTFDGQYRITDLSAYVFLKAEDVERTKSAGDANCGDAVVTEKPELIVYQVGETCQVNSGGTWINATIKQRDTNFDNRYQIKDEKGRTSWKTTDVLRKKSGTTDENGDSNATPDSDSNTNSDQNLDEQEKPDSSGGESTNEKNDEEKEKKKVDVNKTKNKVNGLKNKKIKIGG